MGRQTAVTMNYWLEIDFEKLRKIKQHNGNHFIHWLWCDRLFCTIAYRTLFDFAVSGRGFGTVWSGHVRCHDFIQSCTVLSSFGSVARCLSSDFEWWWTPLNAFNSMRICSHKFSYSPQFGSWSKCACRRRHHHQPCDYLCTVHCTGHAGFANFIRLWIAIFVSRQYYLQIKDLKSSDMY